MKKAMKVLGILLCAVLLVVGSVAATLAYLTDKASVSNTFTVGDVAITLDEQKYTNGVLVEGQRTDEGNNYHLIPGSEFVKDPKVTVIANSDESYVRLMVTIAGTTWDKIDDYIYSGASETAGYNTAWTLVNTSGIEGNTTINGEAVTTHTYEFRYNQTVANSQTNTELPTLFDKIIIPETISDADLANVKAMQKMDVEAHAIQSEGFNNVDAAWAAFEVEYNEAQA